MRKGLIQSLCLGIVVALECPDRLSKHLGISGKDNRVGKLRPFHHTDLPVDRCKVREKHVKTRKIQKTLHQHLPVAEPLRDFKGFGIERDGEARQLRFRRCQHRTLIKIAEIEACSCQTSIQTFPTGDIGGLRQPAERLVISVIFKILQISHRYHAVDTHALLLFRHVIVVT